MSKIISRKEFEEKYCPIHNPFKKEKSILFATDTMVIDVFKDFIQNKCCWSVVKEGDKYYAIPGNITQPIAINWIFTKNRFESLSIKVDLYDEQDNRRGMEDKID